MPDRVIEQSREAIRVGSKSFSAAARLFDRECREDAYMLYAWCRYCDDVIDAQDLGHGTVEQHESADERLRHLRRSTERALGGKDVEDPNFRALQRVVDRHAIPHEYPRHLLDGFAMDVAGTRFRTLDETLAYCYHVAGVVGLMMAHVMGVREPEVLDRACDLGLGFQLTNIARDVMDDAAAARLYLPLDWLAEAGVPASDVADASHRPAVSRVVRRLLGEADRYYASSRWGLPALTTRRAWAIATARRVYRDIGGQVEKRGPSAWDQRVVIGRSRKLRHVVAAGFESLLVAARGDSTPPPSRQGLWSRPQVAG